MHFAQTDLLPRDAMVKDLFRPIAHLFEIPGVTEIAINRPGEAFTEAGPRWQRHEIPSLTFEQCFSMAQTVASYTQQSVDQTHPIVSARLPHGERIQIVVPPAVEQEHVSMTIRIPDPKTRELEQYRNEGFFSRFVWGRSPRLEQKRRDLKQVDMKLVRLLEENDVVGFLKLAIRARKNIAVVGDTGSGKTTLMKAMCPYIPHDERLVTIEDVRELFLPHLNSVNLLYSKGGQGVAKVTPADLISSNMRMKPDRVLLAELRGGEAFDFLKLLTTGHSGSITSYHAESCALAWDRYVFMAKEHEQAAIYDEAALKRLIALTIDIIIHVEVEKVYDDNDEPIRKDRYVSEIHFDPVAKLVARFGDSQIHHA